MRVVAGTARGRTLRGPSGRSTRPTSDRVRESIFNSLGSMDLLDGAVVVDLFAGSGAMGIEALSRGAERAVFVESSRDAAAVIQANLDHCNFVDRAKIVIGPVQRFLTSFGGGDPFDLALIDPPYAFDEWSDLLRAVPAAAAVIESDRVIEVGASWHVVRDRTYGGTVVRIVTREPPAPAADPQEHVR